MPGQSPPEWTLSELDKAYRQGYMAGLAERSLETLPAPLDDVLSASREAGWRDGCEQRQRRQVRADAPVAEPRFPSLLQIRVRNDSARPPLAEPDYRLRMQRLALAPRDERALRSRTERITPATRAQQGAHPS